MPRRPARTSGSPEKAGRVRRQTAAERTLRSTPAERWKRIYELAARVREQRPWRWMTEGDVLGLDLAGDGRWFVSVMGMRGEYQAIALYPVDRALDLLRRAHRDDGSAALDLATGTYQLHCSYETARELDPAEKGLFRELGVTAHQRLWPLLRSIEPGHHPFVLSPREVPLLEAALEQLLEVAPRFHAEPGLLPAAGDSDELLVRVRTGSGWQEERRTVAAPARRPAARASAEALAAVGKLQPSRARLEIDVFPLPAQIGKKGDRCLRPEMLLMVEAESGLVVGADVLTPEPSFDAMRAGLADRVLGHLAGAGLRPRAVVVQQSWLREALEVSLQQLDVKLEMASGLRVLDQVREGLLASGLL